MDDIRKKEITRALEEAMDKATSYENIMAYSWKENNLTRQFLLGFIDSKEYEYWLVHLKKDFAEVILHTIEEMRFALEYLDLPKEYVESAIDHERAHYIEAVANGFQARFCLKFDRGYDGQIGLTSAMQFCINGNNSLTDDKKRKGIRQIAGAPSNPSESDRKLSGR